MLHPVSLFIPLMILLPNLLFFIYPPRNMSSQPSSSIIFTAAEGIGRIGVMIVPIFYVMHVEQGYEIMSMIIMMLSLLLYYGCWCRYYWGRREYRLLFQSFLGIPVPLAISPVIYSLAASVVLHSVFLLIISIVFAAGHIPNSLKEWRRIKQ
ncbi:hypothetical protein [Paenibacillus solani]|uniref:Uncharacterized protein n=1 Tax=Paenibacillus solani TaxID=1705565 RepID=A0A0M1P4D5_9BACL|nr:hypothetical protein [Paenibacillus solani]KOR88894.1 hypothetical protein AM231_06765 [Paenibacillus solani]